MADAKTKQKVQLTDGTNERGVALAYPIYIGISDGVEVANVNASNQLEVEVKNTSIAVTDGGGVLSVDDNGSTLSIDDGDGSITIDGSVSISGNVTVVATDLDIRDLVHTQDSIAIGDGSANIMGVDASGNAQIDIAAISITALPISKDGNVNSASNPIFVNVTNAVGTGEIHDYDSATVTKDASDNHDYAVTATKTLLLERVICSSSGAGKYEVQVGPVASLATKAVQFGSPSNPNVVFVFDPPIEIPDTSTGTVRVIRRNDDNQDLDMYSTIIGREV